MQKIGFSYRTHSIMGAPTSHMAAPRAADDKNHDNVSLLNLIITLFSFAVIAAMVGFTDNASVFTTIAQSLFVLFVVLFLASIVHVVVSAINPYPRAHQ